MLRTSGQALSRSLIQTSVRSSPAKRTPGLRHSSSGASGGGGGGKALVGLGLTSVGVVGGGVAYAGVDPEFRRLTEETVPGASSIFSAVLGDPEPPKPEKPAPKREKINITTTPPSKKRPIKVDVPEEAAKKEAVVIPAVPAPPLEKPSFASGEKTDAPKEEKSKPVTAKPSQDKKDENTAEKSEKAKEDKSEKKDDVREKANLPEDDEKVIEQEKSIHKKVGQAMERMEEEMVRQLKRQSEAHTEHLNEALDVQKKEIARAYVRELDEMLEKSSVSQREELAAIMGHLRGLQSALESRAEMDRASLEAQELWLACSALALALDDPTTTGSRSLAAELGAIKQVLGGQGASDPYVKAVLESIPSEAATSGVSTLGDIKDRFFKVEALAKKTALVPEEGASLMTYALSHLQSLFIMSPSTEDMPNKGTAIDLSSLNTFEVVWLARGSLERGDLEQAVKYVSLLKGQPGNVAKSWLNDARVHLETRQASQALTLHAAAIGVEALPQRKKE